MTTPPVVEPGPATVPRLALMLSVVDVDGDGVPVDQLVAQRLDDVVRSVNAVLTWIAPDAEGHWEPNHAHGATLLAARLDRRRLSPAGVEAFGSEGAVYVQRNDPDVAMLLGLGTYERPGVG